MAAHFDGFADDSAAFFKRLAKHNERAWFTAHKSEYEIGWLGPMKALLEEVHAGIDPALQSVDLGEPKVFRIFRDVRFSKDKRPYKTHVGGYIPTARKVETATDLPMALYFHVGDDDRFGAAGHYMMQPESLARFRAAVASESAGKELVKLLASLEKKGFELGAHERLKRVPKGFDPDHPRAHLLVHKGLFVRFPPIPKGLLPKRELVRWLVASCKTTGPLVEWLVRATA